MPRNLLSLPCRVAVPSLSFLLPHTLALSLRRSRALAFLTVQLFRNGFRCFVAPPLSPARASLIARSRARWPASFPARLLLYCPNLSLPRRCRFAPARHSFR
eukprot:4705977-Pleurochrysis_carterae.AAC.1